MDNLYISVKLLKACWLLFGVMVYGVCQFLGHGIPSNIRQDDETQRGEIVTEKVGMKVEVLSGDETLKKHGWDSNLISLSFYNNKTVYFMTNSCDTIK